MFLRSCWYLQGSFFLCLLFDVPFSLYEKSHNFKWASPLLAPLACSSNNTRWEIGWRLCLNVSPRRTLTPECHKKCNSSCMASCWEVGSTSCTRALASLAHSYCCEACSFFSPFHFEFNSHPPKSKIKLRFKGGHRFYSFLGSWVVKKAFT